MQSYLAAMAIADTPVVLGRRLRPLCAGHLHALHIAGSPYYYGGVAQDHDVIFCVGICSRSYEACMEWMRFASRRPITAGLLMRARILHVDMSAARARLEKYFEQWGAAPERLRSASDRVPLHPPYLLLVARLMELVGESRAWNMPLCRACAYVSALAEIHGDEGYLSEDLENKIQALKTQWQKQESE